MNRKDQVLKCIIEEFIKTAQPVGSVSLLKDSSLDCSSATIRNTMVELEKEGLIEKTHISSGRVPSAKGYQYYLDHLDESSLLSSVDMEFQREFQRVLNAKSQSVEDVMKKSCEMLSEMTKMATVVLGARSDEEHLVSIQVLRLSADSVMGIFITDSGYVEKKTFVLSKQSGINYETMAGAVRMLNDRLVGTKVSDLRQKALALEPLIASTIGHSGEAVLKAFLEALINFTWKRATIYGQKNLLSLPEFSDDRSAVLNALNALEDPSRLEKDLSSRDDLGSVKVGFTNEKLGDLAIVSKPIRGKESIAVVGPRRMDYKKILSALEYVVAMVDRYFDSQEDSQTAIVPVGPAVEVKPQKNVIKSHSKGGHP